LPKSGSFLSVDAPNVIVSSVKQSEKGEDIIVRCVESTGIQTAATLDLKFAHLKWTGNFRPSEIKTLRISKGGVIKEVNLLEE
jgi:alpha-mannosidase